MDIKSLDINLIYSSPFGSYKLGNERIVLHVDDDGKEFINAIGGIEFITCKHFTFLQLLQYEELSHFVCFLFRTLTTSESTDEFKDFFLYDEYKTAFRQNFFFLRLETGEVIKLMQTSEENFELSFYLDQTLIGRSVDTNKHFSGFVISRKIWRIAALNALSKYFDFAEWVESDDVYMLQKLKKYWEELNMS